MSGAGAAGGVNSRAGRRLLPGGLPFDRRGFLRGAGLAGTAAALAACGVPGTAEQQRASEPPVQDLSDADKTVNWSNWPFYIDEAEEGSKAPTTLQKFTKQTGIEVEYTADVNDNDEYFAKIQPQLSGGQAIAADLFVVTDWMVAKLMRLGYLTEFDHANIPNLKNLRPDLLDVTFDPGRKYSITWQSGLAGIAVNPESGAAGITSMDQLLTDRALRGKVTLLTEMRDTVGLTMMDLGYDIEDFTFEQFDKAIAKLKAAVDAGQIRRFTGNDYGADLAKGNVAACVAWTGDVVSLQADNPELEFVVPDAGCTLWSDNFVAPIRSPHKKNAETLVNFYYEPEIATQAAAFINYITPVTGVEKLMEDVDPEVRADPLVFPDEQTLSRAKVFMGLTEEEETRCNRAFAALTGS
jgi:spermidine/putrescine transport system substrate-binding protein